MKVNDETTRKDKLKHIVLGSDINSDIAQQLTKYDQRLIPIPGYNGQQNGRTEFAYAVYHNELMLIGGSSKSY